MQRLDPHPDILSIHVKLPPNPETLAQRSYTTIVTGGYDKHKEEYDAILERHKMEVKPEDLSIKPYVYQSKFKAPELKPRKKPLLKNVITEGGLTRKVKVLKTVYIGSEKFFINKDEAPDVIFDDEVYCLTHEETGRSLYASSFEDVVKWAKERVGDEAFAARVREKVAENGYVKVNDVPPAKLKVTKSVSTPVEKTLRPESINSRILSLIDKGAISPDGQLSKLLNASPDFVNWEKVEKEVSKLEKTLSSPTLIEKLQNGITV